MLKKYDGKAVFSKRTEWIAAEGGKRGEWFVASFSLDHDKRSGKPAVLLFAAADGAEIYVNGKLVHRAVFRTYKFDVGYEVLDMKDDLKQGVNGFRILFRDTGDRDFNGIVFEASAGGSAVNSSDRQKIVIRRFGRLSPVRYMISNGTGAEICDARLPLSGKLCKPMNAGRLLHGPVVRMHRIGPEPLTEDTVSPERIVLRERWAEGGGQAVRLSCGGHTDAVYFAYAEAERDTSVTLTAFSRCDVRLDGKPLKSGAAERLSKGRHLLAAAGPDPEFYLKTDAAVSDWSYAKFSDKKQKKRHYPWNGIKAPDALCESAKAALQADNTDSIQLYNAIVSPVRQEFFPHTRDNFTAGDGSTPEHFSDAPRERIPKVGIGERDGAAVVSPSVYGAAVTFDFGKEQAGYFGIKTDAPRGTVFEIHLYESSDRNGERFMGDKNRVVYTDRGGGETYVTHCRRGFRYAKIYASVCEKEYSLSAFVKRTVYPAGQSSFFCSDETLNGVFGISDDTARVCMLDRYVDCPGYEQNVWTGDARVTALINLTNYGSYDFDESYLELISQSISDGLTECYRTGNRRYIEKLALPCAAFPTYPDGNIPIWSFQWILSVCDHYEYTGDMAAARRCLAAVEETFARAEKQFSPRGLFAPEGTWNLIEWANNDLSEYGEVTANNMMLSYCYTTVSHLEKALGRREKAIEYEAAGERLKALVNRYCYDEKAGGYVDTVRDRPAYEYYLAYCRHTEGWAEDMRRTPVAFDVFASLSRISVQTATLAILSGVAEGDRLDKAKKLLTDCIESGEYVAGTPANRTAGIPSEEEAPGGIVRIGSPFFMFFALDALYKTGEYRLAELAMRRDWGRMIADGAGGCTETFASADGTGYRSAAHGWSASPAYFLARDVLGVRPLSPGFKRFTVDPRVSSVKEASGSVATPKGRITVRWKANGDGYDVECGYPEGVEYVDRRRLSPTNTDSLGKK